MIAFRLKKIALTDIKKIIVNFYSFFNIKFFSLVSN